MMESTLKISAMPVVTRLADDMTLAALRPGAPRNVQLEAGALQGRLMLPEITHLVAEQKTEDWHLALDELPTVGAFEVYQAPITAAKLRRIPLVMITPGEPMNLSQQWELQFWRLSLSPVSPAPDDPAGGFVKPLDYALGTNPLIWIRVL
jgi:hypothetical protein